MIAACLNRNSPEVKQWIESVGYEKTYEQYVKNGYVLPEWETYLENTNSIPIENVREVISDILPVDDYRFENIRSIMFNVPVETQAAFWNNVFYFQNSVSKGTIGEESFHALFGTIFDVDTKTNLLSIGRKAINVQQEVEKYSSLYPSIMNPLSQEQREERVIEEYLASEFKGWYVNNKNNLSSREQQIQKIRSKYGKLPSELVEIFYDFLDTLRTIFNIPQSDRNYLDSLFKSIINGKYKKVRSVRSDTSSPVLSILNYTRNGKPSKLSESESDRVLNTVVATFLKEKENDAIRSDGEILTDVLQAVKIHFENSDLNYATSIFDSVRTKREKGTFKKIEVVNPEHTAFLEELNIRLVKAKKLKDPFLEEDQGENISDENEDEGRYFFADSIQANEVGYEGWSSWIRSYLSTIASTVTEVTLPLGKEIKVVSPVDVNTLYNGVARAVQSTSNDLIRLRKIIEYSELNEGGNKAAKAFINQLIGDTINDYSQVKIEDTISFIKRIIDNTLRTPGESDAVYYKKMSDEISQRLSGGNTKLLNGIVKGFDLWRREVRTQTIKTGAVTSQTTFNSNIQGNSTITQIRKWQRQYNNAGRNIDAFKRNVEKGTDGLVVYVGGETRESRSENLKLKSIEIQETFREQLGIDVAFSTVKYLLISDMTRGTKIVLDETLLPSDVSFYNLFKNDISTIVKNSNQTDLLDGIVKNIKPQNLISYSELEQVENGGTIFDKDEESEYGMMSRLKNLASVNAFFDESVVEHTFKNAENKNIWAFQHKSFSLEFEKNVMSRNWMEHRINKGFKLLREDERGEKIYLKEGIEFIRDNRLLKGIINKVNDNTFTLNTPSLDKKTISFEERFQNFKLFGFDGIRQRGSREGDGVTFGSITTPEFDAFRLNLYGDSDNHISIDKKTYVPFYVGNYEAKRSADFVYLPWDATLTNNEGKYTEKVPQAIKEEFEKEYNRVVKLSSAIRRSETGVSPLLVWNTNERGQEVSKITTNIAKQIFNTDAFDKYNTGTITRIKVNENTYRYVGLRGLEFSDSLKGLLSTNNTQSLLNSALEEKDFNTSWNYNEDVIVQQENLLKKVIDRLRFEPLINAYGNRNTLLNKDGSLNDKSVGVKLLRGVLINNLLNTMAYRQLMHGDPALLFKNDGVDPVKRAGGNPAAISSSEYYIINPELGITEPQIYIKYVTGQEFQEVLGYDPSISKDVADAQNWGTVQYVRKQLWAQGKLTPFEARLLDKIQIGIPLSNAENSVMKERGIFFNVMKTVGFDGITYLKKSDFMLSRQFTSILTQNIKKKVDALNLEYINEYTSSDRKNEIQNELVKLYTPEENWQANPEKTILHNMRVALESKGVDLYMPKSASKMLNVNLHDNVNDPTFSTIEDNIQYIEAKYYGLQLENPAGKERIYDPTQMLEIIFNEQDPTVEVAYNNTVTNLGALEDVFQSYLVARNNGVYKTTRGEFVLPNGEINIETLFNRMTEMLVQSDADFQTIEIFKNKINPNIGITKEKFEHLYFSLFTKGVLKQKVNGDAKAHVSPFGIKKLKKAVRYTFGEQERFHWEVIKQGTPEWNDVIYNNKFIEFTSNNKEVVYDGSKDSDELRDWIKGQWSDAPLYFIDGLRHLKPRWDVNSDGTLNSLTPIAWYSETIMPKWNEKIDINPQSAFMFSVRIPSQDKHSAVNNEWIDVMPEFYGNSVSVPVEIMEISGSDFDVDKLFMIKPEHYESNGQVVYFKHGDNRIRNYREYIEYLKQYHRGFNKAYKEAVKQRNLEYSQSYEEINSLKNQRDSITINRTGNQQFNHQLHLDKFNLNRQIQSIYDGLIEVDGEFLNQITNILKDFNLPTEETFDKEGPLFNDGQYNNPLALNNELLKIRQIALTNRGTLNEENGQAIYKTPATQKALQDLQESVLTIVPNEEIENREEFEKRGDFKEWVDEGAQMYLFKNEQGNKLFSVATDVPMHSFNSHSLSHQNNTTGKRNISAGVNSLLSLITIIKGNLQVTQDNIVEISGHVGDRFVFRNQNDERVFDLISTIISAATDEAKDQQNATYNIGLKALGVIRVMLGLGFPMSTSIAFINQPIVQQYFQEFTLRDQAVLSKNNLEKAFRDTNEVLMELGYRGGVEVRGLTLEDLVSDIKKGTTDAIIKQQLLSSLEIFERMSTQFDEINRLVKLKKGFDGGLEQLNNLEETFHSLGFYLEPKQIKEWLKTHPIDTRVIIGNPKLKQINNYINKVVPDQQYLTSKLFLEASPFYKAVKNSVIESFRNLSKTDTKYIEDQLFEFYSILAPTIDGGVNINPELLISGPNSLGSRILNLRKALSEYEKRKHGGVTSLADTVLSTLIGNVVLDKVFVRKNMSVGGLKVDAIELNTFSKLSNEEQDNIISAFQMLDVATNSVDLYTESEEFGQFKGVANDLFTYFVTKDAFQFKANSLSKMFPATYFGDHGKSIESIVNGSNIILNDSKYNKIIRDVFLETFATEPEHNKYFKTLFNEAIPQVTTYDADEKSITINVSSLDSSEQVENFNSKSNVKIGVDGGLINPPTFSRTKVVQGDSYESFVTKLTFINGTPIEQAVKGEKILSVTYTPVKTTSNTFQSIYTQKPLVLPEIEIDNEETFGRELDKSQEISILEEKQADMTSINIYSTEKNGFEDLSNFTTRPFTVGGMSYQNVESAFQHTKLTFSDPITNQPLEIQSAVWSSLSGIEAKKLGRKFVGLDTVSWDAQSYDIMKTLIKQSFEQNTEALDKLLSTGNATLTHTQDNTKWKTEFPKILMEVRDEFKNIQPISLKFDNTSLEDLLGPNDVKTC